MVIKKYNVIFNYMYLNLIYTLLTIAYFSSIVAYTYDIETNCNCDVKWYFNYLRYYSIVYIGLTIFIFLYTIMLIISQTSNFVFHNTIMKYLLFMFIVIKILGLSVYFYVFFQYQNIIDKDGCGCYRGKFYDIMNISTYIYLGIILLSIISFISYVIVAKRRRTK